MPDYPNAEQNDLRPPADSNLPLGLSIIKSAAIGVGGAPHRLTWVRRSASQ
jgi:hypothetical protein